MVKYCLTCAILIFIFSCNTAPFSADEQEEFVSYILSEIENKNLLGISLACSYGDYNWSSAYGYADLENRVPATIDSRYRLASISKPMTATAIVLMTQKSRLSLDKQVQEYVPYFLHKKWPVSLRQLLGHIGGISHYRDYQKECNTTADMSMQESIALFADWPLLHKPGSKYQYTTYGYNLLGAVIEEVSKMPYQQYMTEQIWLPLDMHHTSVDYLYQIIPDRVNGYRKKGGEIQNCRPVNTSMKRAGGGTISTVGDLIKFARGLSDHKILNKQWLDKMWTSMVLNNGQETGYGMGWGISEYNGRLKIEHSGGQEGTSTMLMHLPDDDLTVAVASNLEGSDARTIANKLIGYMLNEQLHVH